MLKSIKTCTLARQFVAMILVISGPARRLCRADKTFFRMFLGTSREQAASAQCIIRTMCGRGVGGVDDGSTAAYLLTCSSVA